MEKQKTAEEESPSSSVPSMIDSNTLDAPPPPPSSSLQKQDSGFNFVEVKNENENDAEKMEGAAVVEKSFTVSLPFIVTSVTILLMTILLVSVLTVTFGGALQTTNVALTLLARETLFLASDKLDAHFYKANHSLLSLKRGIERFGSPFRSPVGSIQRDLDTKQWRSFLLQKALFFPGGDTGVILRNVADNSAMMAIHIQIEDHPLVKTQICQSIYSSSLKAPPGAYLDTVENCTVDAYFLRKDSHEFLMPNPASVVATVPVPFLLPAAYLGPRWNFSYNTLTANNADLFWRPGIILNAVGGPILGATTSKYYLSSGLDTIAYHVASTGEVAGMCFGVFTSTAFGPLLREVLSGIGDDDDDHLGVRAFLVDRDDNVISASNVNTTFKVIALADTGGHVYHGCYPRLTMMGCFYNVSDYPPFKLLRAVKVLYQGNWELFLDPSFSSSSATSPSSNQSSSFSSSRLHEGIYSATTTHSGADVSSSSSDDDVVVAFRQKIGHTLPHSYQFELFIVVPRTSFLSGVVQARNTTIAIVVVVSLIGAALSYFLIYLSTRSITGLVEKMKDPFHAKLKERKKSTSSSTSSTSPSTTPSSSQLSSKDDEEKLKTNSSNASSPLSSNSSDEKTKLKNNNKNKNNIGGSDNDTAVTDRTAKTEIVNSAAAAASSATTSNVPVTITGSPAITYKKNNNKKNDDKNNDNDNDNGNDNDKNDNDGNGSGEENKSRTFKEILQSWWQTISEWQPDELEHLEAEFADFRAVIVQLQGFLAFRFNQNDQSSTSGGSGSSSVRRSASLRSDSENSKKSEIVQQLQRQQQKKQQQQQQQKQDQKQNKEKEGKNKVQDVAEGSESSKDRKTVKVEKKKSNSKNQEMKQDQEEEQQQQESTSTSSSKKKSKKKSHRVQFDIPEGEEKSTAAASNSASSSVSESDTSGSDTSESEAVTTTTNNHTLNTSSSSSSSSSSCSSGSGSGSVTTTKTTTTSTKIDSKRVLRQPPLLSQRRRHAQQQHQQQAITFPYSISSPTSIASFPSTGGSLRTSSSLSSPASSFTSNSSSSNKPKRKVFVAVVHVFPFSSPDVFFLLNDHPNNSAAKSKFLVYCEALVRRFVQVATSCGATLVDFHGDQFIFCVQVRPTSRRTRVPTRFVSRLIDVTDAMQATLKEDAGFVLSAKNAQAALTPEQYHTFSRLVQGKFALLSAGVTLGDATLVKMSDASFAPSRPISFVGPCVSSAIAVEQRMRVEAHAGNMRDLAAATALPSMSLSHCVGVAYDEIDMFVTVHMSNLVALQPSPLLVRQEIAVSSEVNRSATIMRVRGVSGSKK